MKSFNLSKEIVLYIIFGILAFLVSISTFSLFIDILHLNEHVSNVLSWIITVSFAYITNKKWVFESSVQGYSEVVKEVVSFFGGRIITLIIEEIILFIFITVMHLDSHYVKIAAQIVVIIMNYIISKLWVFKKQ